MGWADRYIAELQAGRPVTFRPRGHSMTPRIRSGDLCTVVPVASDADLAVGDVVLCRVRKAQYLHLVRAVEGARFLIGNNHGRVNGWIGRAGIFGRLRR